MFYLCSILSFFLFFFVCFFRLPVSLVNPKGIYRSFVTLFDVGSHGIRMSHDATIRKECVMTVTLTTWNTVTSYWCSCDDVVVNFLKC